MHSVFFINDREGTVVGSKGTILNTFNGGLTWSRQDSSQTYDLLNVYFTDTKKGLIVGGNLDDELDGGVILYKNNDSFTWYAVESGTFKNLHDMAVTETGACTIIGESGTILFNANYMDVKIDTNITPVEYNNVLYPNYPNPFTNSTMIQYELQNESLVRFEIYNILGQRVKTLVNEVQSAGLYNIDWTAQDDNGEKVSSGLYFYRLQTSDLVETMKMIFLR